jgi:hypothetical protein
VDGLAVMNCRGWSDLGSIGSFSALLKNLSLASFVTNTVRNTQLILARSFPHEFKFFGALNLKLDRDSKCINNDLRLRGGIRKVNPVEVSALNPGVPPNFID